MNRVFKKINYVAFITIIILILFFYYGVFAPLKSELETTLYKNFESTVSITEINVENKLSRFIEGSESLSSRSMIRNEIQNYKSGNISLLELQNYTKDKYSDGVKVLDNIVSASRVTDNRVIAQWGDKSLQDFTHLVEFNNTDTEIKVIQSECLVLINSLIMKDNTILGHDIVVYDLKPLMEAIDKGNLNCKIILDMNTPESFETAENLVEYRQLLNTNYWLQLKLSKGSLYSSLNVLSYKIILGFIILLSLLIFIFYKVSKEVSREVIEQLEEKVKTITEISETDKMLGIYNRSKFFKVLEAEIYRSRRYDHNLSLIMFDIDHFKKINDNYGHLVGDQVLKKLSKIISNEIRTIDLFARYGGDEFMILLPETNIEKAIELAERLKVVLKKTNFDKVSSVSCSFGVTELKSDDDIDKLILKADNALYKAKEKRNTIYYDKT